MRLQLLVPHYGETPHEMRPLLDSLAVQQSVPMHEIGVVVAFDGPDSVPLPMTEWDRRYPFHVESTWLSSHGGVSMARNAALDASTADYVIFCDCDDMLMNACGLYIVWQEMERGFDVLVSNFTEETRKDGKPFYVPHEIDSTFVHGKVYRRGYLADNGIRFCDRLTVHEDSYFVTLARELAKDARYCPTPFYLWRWRDSSVCRHDPDYILKTYVDMLDSSDALVDELSRRGREDAARMRVGAAVLDAYYSMNKPEWLESTHAGYRRAVEERFASFMAKHRERWESLSDAERMAVSNGVRTRSVMEGMQMESVTLGQWLGQIGGDDD